MAQGLLSAALANTDVRSAGLNALVGSPADSAAVRLMRDRGIDITAHRAVQISHQLCTTADLVLVMSLEQRKSVQAAYPTSCGRVFRLAEYTGTDIPDPYGLSEQMFRHVLNIIERGVYEWLNRIRRL